MKIAALFAAVVLASPLAALAQGPAPTVTRTVVTHEQTRSGPIATRPAVIHRIAVRHHRHHHMVRRLVSHSEGPAGARTVTTTTVVRR